MSNVAPTMNVTTPVQVPSRKVTTLASLMSKVGDATPDFPETLRLRLYVLSLPGNGKTTFVSSFPDSIHIDPEDTRRFVVGGRSRRFVPSSGAECSEFIESLIDDRAKQFKHVIIDTIEKFVPLMIPYITDEYNRTHKNPVMDIREMGSEGSGWGRINESVLNMLQRLYNAGYGWTVCGHLRREEVGFGDNLRVIYSPLVNEGIRGGLLRDAQYVMQPSLFTSPEYEKVISSDGRPMQGRLISVRRCRLEFKTLPDPKNLTTRILKDRLGQYMPESIVIGEKDGYDLFDAVYRKACADAKGTN